MCVRAVRGACVRVRVRMRVRVRVRVRVHMHVRVSVHAHASPFYLHINRFTLRMPLVYASI